MSDWINEVVEGVRYQKMNESSCIEFEFVLQHAPQWHLMITSIEKNRHQFSKMIGLEEGRIKGIMNE